jgi:uncharacterized membrane protein
MREVVGSDDRPLRHSTDMHRNEPTSLLYELITLVALDGIVILLTLYFLFFTSSSFGILFTLIIGIPAIMILMAFYIILHRWYESTKISAFHDS